MLLSFVYKKTSRLAGGSVKLLASWCRIVPKQRNTSYTGGDKRLSQKHLFDSVELFKLYGNYQKKCFHMGTKAKT